MLVQLANTNMMGRPTKWSEEMEQQAIAYITEGYKEDDQVIPSISGMALELKVAESTLYKWAEDGRGNFSETLAFCNTAQHQVLLNKGLTGEFNATIVKLALSNHGYSEKTSTDLTSGGQPIKNEWHIHPTTVKE